MNEKLVTLAEARQIVLELGFPLPEQDSLRTAHKVRAFRLVMNDDDHRTVIVPAPQGMFTVREEAL